MKLRSVNLTDRNEKVCDKHFVVQGRNGKFSKWVNDMMDREFYLDPEEAIRQRIRIENNIIKQSQIKIEGLVKKLRIEIDQKEEVR